MRRQSPATTGTLLRSGARVRSSTVVPDRLSVPLDRLAAAGDPQLRRILLYARGRRDPFTAAEAAVDLKKVPARGRPKALRQVGEDFGRELAAAAGQEDR
jgi:hypothetical protein